MEATEISELVRNAHASYERNYGTLPQGILNRIVENLAVVRAKTRPLSAGETGIISLKRPKTAALFADRVWILFPDCHPGVDFVFGWDSPPAIRISTLLALIEASCGSLDEITPIEGFRPSAYSAILMESEGDLARKLCGDSFAETLSPEAFRKPIESFLLKIEGDLARDYCFRNGAEISPLYASPGQRDGNYRPGDCAVVLSVLENVAVVDEDSLTWEQVLEFRKDSAAQTAYRRFVHWLDKEMVGKSTSFICEEVSEKLESYSWALRKHGMQTVLGAVQRTLGASSLFGTSAATIAVESLANQPLVAALAGVGLLVGQATLHVSTALIERNDILIKNRDIAFVHEIHSRLR